MPNKAHAQNAFEREIDIAVNALQAEQDQQWEYLPSHMPNMESTLRSMGDYLHFECGHKIEATVGMLLSVDDGTDLSLCPECRAQSDAYWYPE